MNYKEFKRFIIDSIKLIGRYVRGQIIIAALNGLVAAIAFSIFQLPYAFLLGVIILFTSLIPFVGSIIGFIPIFIIAWTTHHTGWALLWVGIIWLIIQLLETFLFQPWIFGQQLELNPFVVIISIIISGLLFGFIGILITVPLLAIIQLFIRRFKSKTSQ